MSNCDVEEGININTKKVIYSILKEVQAGNEPKAVDYEMEPRDFVKIAQIIKDEGYLKNVAIAATIVWYNHAEITMKGIKYLEENSLLSKTYKGLKELRAWLK